MILTLDALEIRFCIAFSFHFGFNPPINLLHFQMHWYMNCFKIDCVQENDCLPWISPTLIVLLRSVHAETGFKIDLIVVIVIASLDLPNFDVFVWTAPFDILILCCYPLLPGSQGFQF